MPKIRPIPVSKAHLVSTYEQGTFKPNAYSRSKGDIPIVMNDVYYNNYLDTATYQLWYGGGGSGKSYAKAASFLIRALREPFFRLLYTRKTAKDVRDSQFLLFKDIIRDYGLQRYFRPLEGSMDIICLKNNNILLSGGLDDVDKLKSISDITDVWMEEPLTRNPNQCITFEDFTQLDLRLRTPKVMFPRLHMTFNPVTKHNWIYQHFFEKPIYHPVKILQTTYKHNTFSSQKLIATLERLAQIKNDDYLIYHDGEWGNTKTGKEWVYQFSRAEHTGHVPYIKQLPTELTFDFNIQPYTTMLCGQLHLKDGILWLRIYKEYTLANPDNNPEACCKYWIKHYPETYGYVSCNVYGDASGRYGYDSYAGIFRELIRYTVNDSDKVGKKNPYVTTARDLLNEILANLYNIRIIIDRNKCPNLIKDLEDLQETPDGFDPRKEKINGVNVETRGHCYSALIYLVAKLFPELLKENAI